MCYNRPRWQEAFKSCTCVGNREGSGCRQGVGPERDLNAPQRRRRVHGSLARPACRAARPSPSLLRVPRSARRASLLHACAACPEYSRGVREAPVPPAPSTRGESPGCLYRLPRVLEGSPRGINPDIESQKTKKTSTGARLLLVRLSRRPVRGRNVLGIALARERAS
jgi:hypothetical protein